jgi:A/G-specific adenine glycosylase
MPRKSRPCLDKDALDFRRRLLRWFRVHGRDLPWRRTRDPYHIAVSEFMLQQTQVSRVEGFYQRFLERFPSVQDLAVAPAAAVREAWEGLGYYRRAHNLQRLAQDVAARDDGFPTDADALLALPGVGPYTAGAIACFAFERAAPAVDTNVERVIRRVFHPRLGRSAADSRRVWATAARLLPRAGAPAWSFNQAIMELGALVCTARVAKCGTCPV